jgi:hypothetical protein
MLRRGARTVAVAGTLVLGGALAIGGCGGDGTGPEYVAKVVLEPDSAHVEPGESVSFQAVPLGPRDQRYPERAERVKWTLLTPDVAELEVTGSGATISAQEVGTARFEATLGRGSGIGRVFVNPPGLASIEIQPSQIVLRRFTGVQARAILRGEDGQVLPPEGFRISWESSNPDILYIVPNTAVTPFAAVSGRQPGSATLRLVVGPLTTAITVRVEPG